MALRARVRRRRRAPTRMHAKPEFFLLHLLLPLRRPPRLEGGGWQQREQCEVRLQPRAGARVRVRVLSRSVGWLQRAQTVSRTSWRRWNWTTTRI
eukprot:COSAG01_NODE_2999_length_6737_cov_54.759114_2_plen_95_part_00